MLFDRFVCLWQLAAGSWQLGCADALHAPQPPDQASLKRLAAPSPSPPPCQMDGFEDNRGIVVLGATNRPGAIDSALIRPGRFDRIIYMPLPDTEGRAKILQARRKI